MHRRRGALLFLSRVILSGAGLGHTFLDICGMVFLFGFLVAFFLGSHPILHSVDDD